MLYAKFGLNWPISSGEDFFFIFCQYVLAISCLSLLEKGHDPSFEQNGIPITQGCFVPSLVEIVQLVLDKMFFIKLHQCIYTFS